MYKSSPSWTSEFHKLISQTCIEQYQALPRKGKPGEEEWTPLAGVVIRDTSCSLSERVKVVALGTGSKCIGEHKLSHEGMDIYVFSLPAAN